MGLASDIDCAVWSSGDSGKASRSVIRLTASNRSRSTDVSGVVSVMSDVLYEVMVLVSVTNAPVHPNGDLHGAPGRWTGASRRPAKTSRGDNP